MSGRPSPGNQVCFGFFCDSVNGFHFSQEPPEGAAAAPTVNEGFQDTTTDTDRADFVYIDK